MTSMKVLEAYTRDVGRGIIRIDYTTMDKLKISTGDPVSITGKREFVAKAMPLYPSDEDKKIIRMDQLGRNNCGIAIGDKVKIKKSSVSPAVNIVVTALEAIPPIDGRYLADALESVCVGKGDNVMIPYFGGRLTFQVLSTEPKGYVVVSQKTICTIVDKAEVPKYHVNCPTCGQETKDPKLIWKMDMIERIAKIDKDSDVSVRQFLDYLDNAYDKVKA